MKPKQIYIVLSLVSFGMLLYTTRKNFTNYGIIESDSIPFDDSVINYNPFDGVIWETAMSIAQPRGIRNNNPCNLRRSNDAWIGLASVQNDPAFFQFVSAEYGIRAAAIVLKNYYERYGLDTVAKIINRFAPSIENNTTAYINSVCMALNVSANQSINVLNYMPQLINAIIKHENGINPYNQQVIIAGVNLGGFKTYVV